MPDAQAMLTIHAGRMLDGTGAPAASGAVVRVEGSRITAVDAAGEQAPPGEQRLSFPDATLLPGLIDCHTHTNMPGDGRRGEDVHAGDDDAIRLLRSAQNVERALETGVTTVCDCGGWHSTTFRLKEALSQGIVRGPRLLASGRPITVTGGHCWFMGSEADGMDGVRGAARQLLKEGADFLKVMATGGSTLGTDPFRPAFTAPELAVIVEEGHRRARPVAAHCRSNVAMRMVIDAEFDVIMHGWFADEQGARVFDEPLADAIAERGVRVNPTLQITRSRIPILQERVDDGTATDEEAALLERMRTGHAAAMEHTGRLIEHGVRLMAGSDCGWGVYPFGRFDLELAAMVEAGLTPAQALAAATGGNAEALGIADAVGTIAPGKEADLLVVDGRPDERISDVARVLAVVKGGRVVVNKAA
ncbi:MAG: amidohydrolase family protein [Dehalococcoidia bacterium]|nr:amidohydrolase family protein [Dehalococcoidia bacterium]